MNTEKIMALDKDYVMQTYGRQPLALEKGKGLFGMLKVFHILTVWRVLL